MRARLGQRFLVNKQKIQAIIDTLELRSGDTVIEIGAGHGELTQELVNKFRSLEVGKFRITAIEKDPLLATRVQGLGFRENLEIIEGDALKLLPIITKPYTLNPIPYKIVGNIPFYITGRLLRILGELEHKPELVALTIQKEVAKRLTAKPPRMNLLAASVQLWAEPEIIDIIPKKDFQPPPEVDAAVIRLKIKDLRVRALEERYYKLIRILFKQPRKTIVNNLISNSQFPISKRAAIRALQEVGTDENDRPQNLDIATITKLSRVLYNEKQ